VTLLSALWALVISQPAAAQDRLPEIEMVDAEALRANCRWLLRQPGALPKEVGEQLRMLADDQPDQWTTKIQRLLDPCCLIGVSINPESRVKAARGPAPGLLRQDVNTLVLVKVHNEAGVTNAMTVSGPQVSSQNLEGPPGRRSHDRWLQAEVITAAAKGRKLSGHAVEYALLRLQASTAGKREATLKFDVGQGTQDLGFRAEVPVLFTVQVRRAK
jgi:hypothetical protein